MGEGVDVALPEVFVYPLVTDGGDELLFDRREGLLGGQEGEDLFGVGGAGLRDHLLDLGLVEGGEVLFLAATAGRTLFGGDAVRGWGAEDKAVDEGGELFRLTTTHFF